LSSVIKPSEPPEPTYKVWLHRLGVVFTLGVFVFAIWVLQKALKGFDFAAVWHQLGEIPLLHVALALLFTLVAYVILTVYDSTAFLYIRRPMAYHRVAWVSFIAYAFSHNLGFGALTGGSVRYRFYSAWGVGAFDIAKVILFGGSAYILGMVAAAGLVLIIEADLMASVTPVPEEMIILIGIACLVVGSAYLIWSLAGGPVIRARGTVLAPPRPPLVLAQITTACLEWTAASAVLYFLLPPHSAVSFPLMVAIFVISYVLAVASHVPGGLGVFEALVINLMPDEVPQEAVLAALISYRGIYMLLPLLIAALMFGGYEVRQAHGLGRWLKAKLGRAPKTPEAPAMRAPSETAKAKTPTGGADD
jgi:uncharacterized membrane protein YbhN (UPF0104 family)